MKKKNKQLGPKWKYGPNIITSIHHLDITELNY